MKLKNSSHIDKDIGTSDSSIDLRNGAPARKLEIINEAIEEMGMTPS